MDRTLKYWMKYTTNVVIKLGTPITKYKNDRGLHLYMY